MTTGRIDYMVDIESFDTEPTSCVLSIGVVRFDPQDYHPDSAVILNNRHIVVELDFSQGSISEGTVSWWMMQSQEARSAIFGNDVKRLTLEQALFELVSFVDSTGTPGKCDKDSVLWALHPKFDYGILEHHMKRLGITVPWRHGQLDDVATVRRILGKERVGKLSNGCAHNAVADCHYQIRLVQYFNHLWNTMVESGRPAQETT